MNEKNKKIILKKIVFRILNIIKPNQIIGLGSGSTVAEFLEIFSKEVSRKDNISYVASSMQISIKAKELGLELIPLETIQELDIVIDGADEADERLRLIKGGGGALLKERILANLCKKYLVIVTENKMSETVGLKHRIPVEINPVAYSLVSKNLYENKIEFNLRTDNKNYPIFTENRNIILDVEKGNKSIDDMYNFLKNLSGVNEVGIFLSETTELIVIEPNDFRVLKK